jgi:hypothetical protein
MFVNIVAVGTVATDGAFGAVKSTQSTSAPHLAYFPAAFSV